MDRTVVGLLVAVVSVVGIVGTVVPLLPGLTLVLAAVLLGWVAVGWSGGAVLAAVVVGVLFAAGTAAKVVLPARTSRSAGVPRATLLWGALGAVVGFFMVPVVGLLLGGLAGVWLAERARLGDGSSATVSTRATARGIGIGVLVEVTAGLAMLATWVVAYVLLGA